MSHVDEKYNVLCTLKLNPVSNAKEEHIQQTKGESFCKSNKFLGHSNELRPDRQTEEHLGIAYRKKYKIFEGSEGFVVIVYFVAEFLFFIFMFLSTTSWEPQSRSQFASYKPVFTRVLPNYILKYLNNCVFTNQRLISHRAMVKIIFSINLPGQKRKQESYFSNLIQRLSEIDCVEEKMCNMEERGRPKWIWLI